MMNRKQFFSIQTRKVGSVTIFDMSGHLSIGAPVDELLASVGKSVDKNEVRIVLNMANVGYIDSAGIESLIQIYKAARERDGEIKLLNLTRRVNQVMHLMQLTSVFDIEIDEEVALASFNEGRRSAGSTA